MADEFQSGICSGNWWNSERIISSSTTTTGGISSQLPFTTASSDVINIGGGGSTNNYGRGGGGWHHEQEEPHQMKAISCRSSDESGGASVTCSSSVVFQDTNNNNNNQKPQESDSIGGSGNSILMDSTLQMMSYGLSSSPSMDWNPSLLNNNQSSSSGRSDHNNFGCMLQEDLTSSRTTPTSNIYRHHQEPGAEVLVLKDWSPKNFSSSCSTITGDQDSSSVVNGTFQQHNIIQQGAGFSLDHHHPSNNHLLNSTTSSSECTVTCDQGLPTSFPMDHSSTLYGCPSSFLQGLFEPDYQSSTTTPQSVPSSFPSMTNNYFMNTNDQLPPPSWPSVVPKLPRHQFLKNTITTSSPPKPIQQQSNNNNQLHFSNNARFWNANSVAAMNNSRPSFFPSQQIQLLTPPTSYEEKPNCSNQQNPLKNKANSSSVVKKSGSNEPSFKRPRVETPSPLPTFKVRKEKLGDRITALQQLVSPFGKTDTASVLFEAIEYIKLLHDQVTVLSASYLKNGAHIQHHQQMQNSNKTKEAQGSTTEKDLRSRGLCLVPISSTFPVTIETATDFWTPTFGGTYRARPDFRLLTQYTEISQMKRGYMQTLARWKRITS